MGYANMTEFNICSACLTNKSYMMVGLNEYLCHKCDKEMNEYIQENLLKLPKKFLAKKRREKYDRDQQK
jgi:hypothetical protein